MNVWILQEYTVLLSSHDHWNK